MDESDNQQLVVSVAQGSMIYLWDGTQADGTSGTPNPNWTAGGPGTNLPSGEGFLLFFFDDNLDPIENPAGFTFNVDEETALTDTDVVIDEAQTSRFYVLGNPFPAGFDLDDFSNLGGPLSTTVQIYNPGTGAYNSRTQGGSNDILGMWQGFVVERTGTGTGKPYAHI